MFPGKSVRVTSNIIFNSLNGSFAFCGLSGFLIYYLKTCGSVAEITFKKLILIRQGSSFSMSSPTRHVWLFRYFGF